MEARYFRVMFHNVNKGLLHTVCVEDTAINSKWTAYYLCGNNELETALIADEKILNCKERIQLLVIADLDNACLEKALEIIMKNTVEQVILPECTQEILDELKSAEPGKIKVLKTGEMVEIGCDIWQASLKCYGESTAASIAMYHGPEEMKPELMDCVLAIKTGTKQKPCKVCIDSNNLGCDMSCGLYNDFDICKGHNKKSRDNYITGTLLLGRVNLHKNINSIQKDFEGMNKYIRFISIPESCTEADWNCMMNWLDKENKEDKKYFMPLSGEQGNERILKSILEEGPLRVPLLTSKDFGICASGFYTKRK